MPYTVTIDHIDTCLSCYLTDHHNREGEKLLGVEVTRETTYGDLFARLAAEWDRAELYEDFDAEVIEHIEHQFTRVFGEMINENPERLILPFDLGLDPGADYEGVEPAQAWFLVRYSEDDQDAEDARDAAIATRRIAELQADPASAISGAELAKRMAGWADEEPAAQPDAWDLIARKSLRGEGA